MSAKEVTLGWLGTIQNVKALQEKVLRCLNCAFPALSQLQEGGIRFEPFFWALAEK